MEAGMKLCTKCGVTQSTVQFCKHSKTKDGLQSWCRTCAGEASKFNQGMKRQQKRELRELLDSGDLGYQIALQELKEQFQKAANALAVKYHKKQANIAWTYKVVGEDNGKTNG